MLDNQPDPTVSEDPDAGTAAPDTPTTENDTATHSLLSGADDQDDGGIDSADGDDDEAGISDDEIVYDLGDGKEKTLAEIKAALDGGLRQDDYTRKTQALSEDRAQFETQRAALGEKLQTMADIEAELESALLGDLKGVNLNEMLENDNSADYLKAKEKIEATKATVARLSAKRQQVQAQLISERSQELHTAMEWDNPSKKEEDLKLILGFAQRENVPQQEFAKFLHPAIMKAFRLAEQHVKLQEGKPETRKRVRRGPKVPGATNRTARKGQSLASRMYPGMKE